MKNRAIENMTEKDVIDAGLASIDAVADLVEKLVDKRKLSGLTQKEIAKYMGVKQSAVARFENMLVIPKANTLCLYAAAVGEKIDLKSEKQNITLYIFKSEKQFFADDDSFELSQFHFGKPRTNASIISTSCTYRNA